MNEYRTKTGRILTDADLQALADEAERSRDVDHDDPMHEPCLYCAPRQRVRITREGLIRQARRRLAQRRAREQNRKPPKA